MQASLKVHRSFAEQIKCLSARASQLMVTLREQLKIAALIDTIQLGVRLIGSFART